MPTTLTRCPTEGMVGARDRAGELAQPSPPPVHRRVEQPDLCGLGRLPALFLVPVVRRRTVRPMGAKFDRVVRGLHRRLRAESEADLQRGMHYPVRWDPFFKDFMTLADVYHFATQHFDFHHRQLTIEQTK